MENKEQQFEKIENYLSGKMQGKERVEFEQGLEKDAGLKMELELQKEMHEYMASTPKDALRETLSDLRGEFSTEEIKNTVNKKKPMNNWLLGFMIVIIAGAIWFLWEGKNSDDISNSINNEIPIEKPTTNEDFPEDERIENDEGEEKENTDNKKEEIKKEDVNNKNDETVVPSRPIADVGDYQLNPLIEAELNDNLRGDYEFEIKEPAKDKKYSLNNGRINFILNSVLKTDKMPEEDFSLIVEIYDNNEDNYKLEKPILQSPLELSGEAPFDINFNSALKVEKRIYYYLIKDDYSGVILTGGKFRVE